MEQSELATWITGIMLALLLSASCSGIAMLHQIDQGQTLTPEQIEKYKQMDMDVYGCFALAGPPPLGSTTWIVVPKSSKVTFKFGDGCRLLNQ